jgi:hypothetical protein
MRVAIFICPADAEAGQVLLNAFHDMNIEASLIAVRPEWESKSVQELKAYVGEASHFLIVWSESSRSGSWLPFAVGYSLGQGTHQALFRIAPAPELPGYLSDLPLMDSAEELSTFYIVEQSLYMAETEKSQARRELFDLGLSYSVEGMADCVRDGNLKAVELFIKTGLSPDAKNRHGVPMICQAARFRHRRILALLIERGASVDAQSEDRGNTALMDAASCGAADIVSDLLAARAKTDLLSKDGQTALIISVGRNDVAVTGQLLAAGADADIKDKLGISARKYASLFHNPQIVELFEKLSPA